MAGRGTSSKPSGDVHGATNNASSGARGGKKKEPLPSTPVRRSIGGAGSPEGSTIYMTSTEAQNGFGRVLDTVARNNTVVITKRNSTQAVVMSIDRYDALTRGASSGLDTLTAEFDDLLIRMQTPRARDGLRDAFRASPSQLADAAVAAARAPE